MTWTGDTARAIDIIAQIHPRNVKIINKKKNQRKSQRKNQRINQRVFQREAAQRSHRYPFVWVYLLPYSRSLRCYSMCRPSPHPL